MSKRVENVRIQIEPTPEGAVLKVVHIGRNGKYNLHRGLVSSESRNEPARDKMIAIVQDLMDNRLRFPTEV